MRMRHTFLYVRNCADFLQSATLVDHRLIVRSSTRIVRQDRASSLKASQCPLSDDEWQAILEDIFEQRHHSGIQATATVETGKSITITIRKEIQGFTVSLGIAMPDYIQGNG